MKDNINISEKDGQILVKTTRMVVTDYLKNGSKTELGKKFQEDFSFNSGVFVTLNNPLGLRGCIGYPLPDKKLFNALEDAAISAATRGSKISSSKI